jgi:putative spermidine/putrescine transport system substrate-binding protein
MSSVRVRTRRLATLAVAALTVSTLAACGGGDGDDTTESGGKTTLTVVSYGGGYQEAQAEALFEPFEKANPDITIVQDSPTDVSKLQAMVEAGKPQWDVALVANDFGNESQSEWLEPIDYSVVDKDAILPGYAGANRVGADVEGTVVAYRTDKVDTAPESWADFFDTEAFPGKRAMNKYAAGGILEGALLADGVAPEELYPLDVDRALAKLDTIKDDIVWWETAAQSQQLLESGEAALGLVWIGRATDAAKTAPVEIDWNTWTSQDAYWVVPKGTDAQEAAMEFIAFATSKEPQEKLASLLPYGVVNAEAATSSKVAADPNRPSNHLDTQVRMDDEWWAENVQDVNDEFNEWLLG